MITKQMLIRDEREAIQGYEQFLAQGRHNKKTIKAVEAIIRDEERHIKILEKDTIN